MGVEQWFSSIGYNITIGDLFVPDQSDILASLKKKLPVHDFQGMKKLGTCTGTWPTIIELVEEEIVGYCPNKDCGEIFSWDHADRTWKMQGTNQ